MSRLHPCLRPLPPRCGFNSRIRETQWMRPYDVTSLGEVVYQFGHAGEAQVSVVIPLYNYASAVLEALDSVVRQDLPALSVIVIDDASTDNGGEKARGFLEQHAARFIEVRLVRHHHNQGLSMARNS